ncbi:MAG: hypothetical protein V3U26_00435 [Dehalococcoidia bacterium]
MRNVPQVGDPAPEFALPGTDGHHHSLAGLRGRRVLVPFLRHLM